MRTAREIRKRLRQFSPVTKTYKHSSEYFRMTSEVRYLEKAANCNWLIDFIADCQPRFRRFQIQYWRVDLVEDLAIVTLLDSNNTRIFWRCHPANGFPLWEGIELRVCCDLLYVPRKRKGRIGKRRIDVLQRTAA
jgi:hypothetical protein